MFDQTLLHPVWQLAERALRPCASAADGGDLRGPVLGHVQNLARAGFFGLGVPTEHGGLGADEVTRHEFTEILASACGVTAFTQQQLLIGIGFLVAGRNQALKAQRLPTLARGDAFCGIALSHLRRDGPPPVRAERVPGGYRLSGTIPWVTAWDLLDCFVLGAVLAPGGEHVFALVDKGRHAASLSSGPPLPLGVMRASGTLEVAVTGLPVRDEDVLHVCDPSDLRRAEFREITSHTALPLGCARGAASFLRALAQQRQSQALGQTAMALTWEIDQCHTGLPLRAFGQPPSGRKNETAHCPERAHYHAPLLSCTRRARGVFAAPAWVFNPRPFWNPLRFSRHVRPASPRVSPRHRRAEPKYFQLILSCSLVHPPALQ